MLPAIFLPEEYLQLSRQLYCLITDAKGKIICLNHVAAQDLGLQANAFIHNDTGFIETVLQSKQTSAVELCFCKKGTDITTHWDIIPLYQYHLPYFKWLSPVVPNKTNTPAGSDQYKQYIKEYTEGIFRLEFRQAIPINQSAESLCRAIASNAFVAECNETMAIMHGYGLSSELVGVALKELINLDHSFNQHFIRNFIKNGFKLNEAETYKKDQLNKHRYFVNNLVGIIEDDYLKIIWGTQKEITLKKQTDEKIRTLASLVEQTSDVLTMSDLEFKPLIWNKAAERIYGLTADQVIGRNLRDFIDITYQHATRDEVREAILAKGEWRGEMYFVRPTDGKKVTLWISFKPLKNEREELIGYIVGGSDISELKQIEQKLIESESRFKALASSAPVMIWMSDAQYDIVYLNQSFAQFIGKNIQRLHHFAWRSFIHPDDEKLLFKNINESLSEKKAVKVVYRMMSKSGVYRWVLDTVSPRFLEDGTFVGFIGCIVDIHEQKAIEEQLRYQVTLLENVSDLIVIADLDFCIQSANKVAEEFFQLHNIKYTGKPFAEVIALSYSDDQKKWLTEFYTKGSWKGEVSFINEKGEVKYLLNTLSYVFDNNGEKIGIMMVGRDITDRKIAEEKLRRSEEFYRTLISDSVNGMILVDEYGEISFAASSVKNVLGYLPEELTGRNAFDFVHPHDRMLAWEIFKTGLVKPQVEFVSIRLIKKNGQPMWCMVRGHNLLHHPLIGKVVLHFHDDTLRKKASDALEESEQRFRALISDLQIGVMLVDKESKVIICNNAMQTLLHQDLSGNILYHFQNKVIHEDGTAFAVTDFPIYKALHFKQKVKDVVIGVHIPDVNDYIWVIVNADPILDEEGEILHVLATCVDITERRRLEQKLLAEKIQHQKLLTQATIDGQEKERREIGKELHDNIGQQLTSIKLYLELACTSADEGTREMVHLAAKNVLQVINEVRNMSRSLVPPTLGDLGLIASVQELVDNINRTQGLKVVFKHEDFREEQIAHNKKLTIFRMIQEQLSNIVKHANASSASIEIHTSEKMLQLIIQDDGNGFDEKKIRKGLGLTNIKNRAELFGGRVEVQSAIGHGCTVSVHIPHSLEPVAN